MRHAHGLEKRWIKLILIKKIKNTHKREVICILPQVTRIYPCAKTLYPQCAQLK